MSYNSHDYKDRINFTNTIMVDKEINKGKHRLRYKLKKCKEKGTFDILKSISENVTLAQMMDSLGNMDHTVIVVGKRILIQISKTPLLNIEPFNLICSCSHEDQNVVLF